MKFEQPKSTNIASNPIQQPEEFSASEKVLLAQLESNLKSLTVDGSFPVIDSTGMSDAMKFRYESVCTRIADSNIKKGTATGLIIVARLIEWMRQNNLDSSQVNDVTRGDYLNEQARFLYEKNLNITYKRELQDACLLQKFFEDAKHDFLLIAESKREMLKHFALRYTEEVVKSVFEILPSLKDDEDLKVDAKRRLTKTMEKEGSYQKVAELVRTYPKDFFTVDEILPAVTAMLEYELDRNREFQPESIKALFSLTEEETNLVVNKVLDKSLNAANISFVETLATAYGVDERTLQAKASVIYEKWLRDHSHRHSESVVKIAPLVSEEFESRDEIIGLKREWALENINTKGRYFFSYRRGREATFKEQFNLSDDYLAMPESQKKLQEKLLSTLSYGNYSIAIELYEKFLTNESKTDDFQTQIEASFLQAIQRDSFSLKKDSSEAKLIDIFSETFKQTPQFREQAQITLSSLLSEGNLEKIDFAIEKLGCTNEEVRAAKERALLSAVAYVSRDGNKLNIKTPDDRYGSKVRELLKNIQPDEEILNSVRIKLNNAVLQNESIKELNSLRNYTQFFGMSDNQIIEQAKIKEVICRDVQASIQKGELNNAVSTGKFYKLTAEDITTIDKDIVVGGVRWWLSEELKSLTNPYGNWKHVPADIDAFIRFFNPSQEELFQDEQIRKHGGQLLLAGRLFYNLEGSRIEETLAKTLLITEEDMMNSVDLVLQQILRRDKSDDQERYLKNIVKMLPELPPGFADEALAEAYLSNIDSYPIPDRNSYRGRDSFRYGHERRNRDIRDFLIEKMNLMQTFEAKQKICQQTFFRLVDKGAFEAVGDLLFERKALPFVSKEVRQEALLPEYVRLFTEEGEESASRFAKSFQIDVNNVTDERLQTAYQRMFREEVLQGNVDGIVASSKKTQFSQEFLDSPEIKNGLEQAFIASLSERGLEMAIKLTQSGLIDAEFLHTEQVRIAARSYVPNLLSNERYTDIVTLNSQLSLGITPREIIALDSQKERFFEKLDEGFPKLSAKCRGSLDALFSIWPYVHLLDSEILNKYPFLAEALQENDRFGSKLLLKFQSLDKLSQTNIQTLYRNKAEISSQNNIEPESRDFRISMQQRLESYRRNSEITQTLRGAGINVEEWLNHEDEIYFTLGRDESLRFSETIVTPIERIQETINSYTATIKEVLEEYKIDLLEFKVPLKDASLLQSQLDKLIEQKQIAEQSGDVRKIEGISKGITNIEMQMSETKEIPLWDKVMSSIASLDLVKKDISNAYTHLCDVEFLLNQMEEGTDMSNAERRKELLKLKKRIDSSKKELQEKVQLLGVRLAEFDKSLYSLLSPALGEDRTDSLIQEKNELAQEHIDHYQSDSKTLAHLFYQKEDDNLVGQHMKIGLWDRNPNKDLYLGNYTDCCIRIDSAHMGAESTIADYLTDVGVQVVLVTDEKKNIPVVAAWCWIGHDDNDQVAFVIDNIEANTDYSANFRNQLEVKLKEYIQNYSNKVGAKLVQGRSNNDLVIANMDSAYFKLGGYNRPSGYFLEGEDNRAFAGEADEDPGQWDGDENE